MLTVRGCPCSPPAHRIPTACSGPSAMRALRRTRILSPPSPTSASWAASVSAPNPCPCVCPAPVPLCPSPCPWVCSHPVRVSIPVSVCLSCLCVLFCIHACSWCSCVHSCPLSICPSPHPSPSVLVFCPTLSMSPVPLPHACPSLSCTVLVPCCSYPPR